MSKSNAFLSSVLDSLAAHIVVLDSTGTIVFVNRSWEQFAKQNCCALAEDWAGVNYLNYCQQSSPGSAGESDSDPNSDSETVYQGILSVIEQKSLEFEFEYPCHSPDEQRWFTMSVCSLSVGEERFIVISHSNITERKLAEDRANQLARLDSLTGLANRRVFNSVLQEELRRCRRNQKSMALAIVDIDHFKCINDTYGHQAGDDCLIKVAELLESFVQRPGDLCARYGGEEFAIIWSGLDLEKASRLAGRLLEAIRALNIPNEGSSVLPFVTASIGLTAVDAGLTYNAEDVIKQADQHLYKAKDQGRNRLCY